MLKINKQTITLTKGDDASLRLVPKYKDKTAYTVQEGDRAVVRLKIGNVVKVIECSVNTGTNKIVVNFEPDDTKDFNPGIYRYEAELITSFGFHYTFIADQSFILGKELEEHILPNTNRNGSTSGNLPEIDGDMGEEPVVNGEIQPTNPMMDYEELNHLPKLNNVVIKGDHDSAYYGIATKTSDLENDSDFVSDADYVHTDSNFTAEEKTKLGTVESGAEKNVQPDWNEVDTTNDDFIKNKPTKLSQFSNDQGFVTNSVQNLMFYYLKSETYTKAEVEQLISAIKQGKFVVVETLPQNPDPNVIYLVPKSPAQTSNAYDEYVYINNNWEKIGDTDIDLSGYVTDDELTTALQAYLTSADFYTAIANYYTKTETDTLLNNKVDKVSGKGLSTNDYDNTAKGIVDGVTSALADKVDKVNGKGLSTEDYTTAEKTKLGTISDEANKVTSSSTNGHINIDGVDTTVYNDTAVQTAIDNIEDELSTNYATVEGNPINFTTLSAQTAKSTILSCEPIQDLHGYDKPWVGGVGKNKLPLTVDGIKSANSGATWTGNSCTIDNVTFTIKTDSDNNVIGIAVKRTGTSSGTVTLVLAENFNPNTSVIMTGCPSGGQTDKYVLNWQSNTNDIGSGVTVNNPVTGNVRIQIINTSSAYDLVYYPMIRLSTESDATFAPYTNECSISGRTEIGILGCGENLYNPDDAEVGVYLDTDSSSPTYGQTISASGYWTSGYIPVIVGATYFKSALGTGSSRNCFYDKYKNCIGTVSESGGNSGVLMPANTAYFRFVAKTSTIAYNDELSFTKDAKATEYKAFNANTNLTIHL